MYYYAQLDSGVVCGVSETHSEIGSPNMIALESFDASLLGKVHKGGKTFEIPPVARKGIILARLAEIDAISDKPRTRRELTLSKAATKTWLQGLDDEAITLRTELATLP